MRASQKFESFQFFSTQGLPCQFLQMLFLVSVEGEVVATTSSSPVAVWSDHLHVAERQSTVSYFPESGHIWVVGEIFSNGEISDLPNLVFLKNFGDFC